MAYAVSFISLMTRHWVKRGNRFGVRFLVGWFCSKAELKFFLKDIENGAVAQVTAHKSVALLPVCLLKILKEHPALTEKNT